MNARTRVRRTTVAGIGAAALTTAAVLGGPSVAAAAPADDTGGPAAEETTTQEDGGSNDADSSGSSNDSDDSTGSDSGSGDSSGDGGLENWIPQDLQQDLEDLRDLPADEQVTEAQNIVERALGGEYGDQVQNWLDDVENTWSHLPSDLRTDIQDALAQDADQEGDDLGQVWEDARNGEYGEAVETWTDWAAGAVSSFSVDN